jgi:membrane protein
MIQAARSFAGLIGDAVAQCSKDNVARMSAALAYYSLFALAPIIYIALSVASVAVGSVAAEAQLRTELDLLAGPSLETAIERILASYHALGGSFTTEIGLVALALGASGIFLELRESMDAILGRRTARRAGLLHLIKLRTLAFAMVLLGSTLLLAGMAASVAFAGFVGDAAGLFPKTSLVVGILGSIVLLMLSTVLFALLYRQLPRPKPTWREAWAGASIAAVLFVVGEFGLSSYLARLASVSHIGTAGSIIAVLVWVYYSAQIVYFGAEFAKAFGLRTGLRTASQPT